MLPSEFGHVLNTSENGFPYLVDAKATYLVPEGDLYFEPSVSTGTALILAPAPCNACASSVESGWSVPGLELDFRRCEESQGT